MQTLAPVALLVADNISYSVEDKPVLSGFSLTVRCGDCLALVGANGSGKTTLLKLLCGLLPPDTGSIHWHGDATKPTGDELLYAGHRHALCGDLTAYENLTALAALRHRENKAGLDEALAFLGVARDIPCRKLSAGQRQRATLARLVAFAAEVWILDEPHACLDRDGRALLDDVVSQHVAEGGTVLVSTHDVDSLTATTRQVALGDR